MISLRSCLVSVKVADVLVAAESVVEIVCGGTFCCCLCVLFLTCGGLCVFGCDCFFGVEVLVSVEEDEFPALAGARAGNSEEYVGVDVTAAA